MCTGGPDPVLSRLWITFYTFCPSACQASIWAEVAPAGAPHNYFIQLRSRKEGGWGDGEGEDRTLKAVAGSGVKRHIVIIKGCQPEEVTILRVCQPIAGLQAEEARSHRYERERERRNEVRE